jgi:hypothetical protein
MSQENPTWGAPGIQSELKLLGYEVADSTVIVDVKDRFVNSELFYKKMFCLTSFEKVEKVFR